MFPFNLLVIIWRGGKEGGRVVNLKLNVQGQGVEEFWT